MDHSNIITLHHYSDDYSEKQREQNVEAVDAILKDLKLEFEIIQGTFFVRTDNKTNHRTIRVAVQELNIPFTMTHTSRVSGAWVRMAGISDEQKKQIRKIINKRFNYDD